MKDLREIHNEALRFAKQANEHLEKGEKAEYLQFTIKALELEKEAAEILFAKRDAEPTRSVLYRSAATLAFNCGRYTEAKQLIYCALVGTPHTELKEELDSLLNRTEELIEAQATAVDAVQISYIGRLKRKGVNWRMISKDAKYGKAIVTEHIIDFLRTVNSAYTNFTRVSFNKAFDVTSDNTETPKMLDTFLKESKPLCVDLGFNSFGVSIASDNDMMFKGPFYSREFQDWKDNLFEDFKNEVVLPDYNSPAFLRAVKEKYTEEERNMIYSPILNSAKKTSAYEFYLTDDTFKQTLKTYPAPTDEAKGILQVKPVQLEDKAKVLTRSFDLVSSTGKGRKKNIQSEKVDYAEFTWLIKDLSSGNKNVALKDDYELKVIYDHGVFKINDENFNIFCTADDDDKVIQAFDDLFIAQYSKLLSLSTLTAPEEEMKNRLDNVIFSRDW
jgi:hypothetical protein